MFIQLTFINTITNTPLNQVPDSDFSDAGINIWASPAAETSECFVTFASSSLTTDSVINGSTLNESLYYYMLDSVDLQGKWYSLDNTTQVT